MTAPLQLLGSAAFPNSLQAEGASEVGNGKPCHADRILIQVYFMLLNSRRYKCMKGVVPFPVARSPPAESQAGDGSGGFSKQHLSDTIRQGREKS